MKPDTKKPAKIQHVFRCDKEDFDRLHALATRYDYNTSFIIRHAIKAAFPLLERGVPPWELSEAFECLPAAQQVQGNLNYGWEIKTCHETHSWIHADLTIYGTTEDDLRRGLYRFVKSGLTKHRHFVCACDSACERWYVWGIEPKRA